MVMIMTMMLHIRVPPSMSTPTDSQGDLIFIPRMAVEFYMTEGKYLSIGRLACSGCKIKGLKGLDFSNSYLVPESGHPLEQEQVRKRPREEEDEEQRRVMMSPGVRSKVEQVEVEEKKVVVVTKK